MAELTLYLLQDLNYDFTVDTDATTKDFAVLRTKFQTAEEVHSFVKKIETHTKTNYVTWYNNPYVEKVIFHKKWICRCSSYGKNSKSKRNAGCTSFIDVIIKKINKNTKKNDKFLKMKDPLPCLIKINIEHTHSTENVDFLRKLRVSPEIIKEFEEYFNMGLPVCEARSLHKERLTARYDYSILTNSALYPTVSQVHYLYKKWRTKSAGPVCDPISKSKENLSTYENKAGVNGKKRRKLKRTAIPSSNLPISPENADECEDKLEKMKEPESNKIIPISGGSTDDVLCIPDEIDSDESTGYQEDIRSETSESSVDDINKEQCMDTSPSIAKIYIMTPNYSHADMTAIEHTSKNISDCTQNCKPSVTENYIESPNSDYSVFKFTPNDSREILTQKLETVLSFNATLQKKVEFYQRKCEMYEKEVITLKSVIDSLKLINSVNCGN